MGVRAFGITGASGVVLTWLGIGLNNHTVSKINEVELPIIKNEDTGLLRSWASEDIYVQGDGSTYPTECNFYNFTNKQDSTYCDSFTIARTVNSIIHTASERATRCGGEREVECVLNHEVGFAVPSAFILSLEGTKTIVAPRLIREGAEMVHVRTSTPDDDSQTRTVLMYTEVEVEFMDGSKRLKVETFTNEQAFCVQLLRASYEASCWIKLDG